MNRCERMKLAKKYLVLLVIICLQSIESHSFAPTNFYRPYDVNYRTEWWLLKKQRYHHLKVGTQFEYGATSHGRNTDGEKTNVLSLYHAAESAITMVYGANEGSEINQLASQLRPVLATTDDDGLRGRFNVTGKYEEFDVTPYWQYNFRFKDITGNFDISCLFPFRKRKFYNVQWQDLTQNNVAADTYVQQQLTSDIDDLVADLGNELKLRNWKKSGIGDVACMLRWFNDFIQYKKRIKKVRITARIGLTFPTGARRDEDHALSLPLGNDGAVGLPFAVGLDVYFKNKVKLGGEFEAFKLFDVTREFRLKTDRNQTDFLLLHKGRARKHFGMTWKINLYVGFDYFYRGLSAFFMYQFLRHDDDRLYPKSYDFDEHIINTAERLQDWTFQNVIFQINYDFFKEFRHFPFRPQLMAFVKFPASGRRVINPITFGGQVVFNF